MNLLQRINRLPRIRRWLVKGVFVGVVYLLVLYPRFDLLPRHLAHITDPQALTDPTNPSLQPLLARVKRGLQKRNISEPAKVLRYVQKIVLLAVPYAWDWDTWGVVDYLPSIEETLAKGQEDCDGRAVVAAAILRGLGYDARLTSDSKHVWVWTPYGETMHPGGPAMFERAADGTTRFNTGVLKRLPVNLGYGMAVFPLWRQIVVALAVWLAVTHPAANRIGRAVGLIVLVQGLLIMRLAAVDPYQPVLWGIWLAFGHLVLGLVVVARRPKGGAERGATAQPAL